jgi:protein required for attachment to host cells
MRSQTVGLQRSPITWVFISDGKQSKCFTRMVTKKTVPVKRLGGTVYLDIYDNELNIVPEMNLYAESKEIYEVGYKKLSSIFESHGSAQHRSEPHIRVEDEIKIHFAKLVAKHINEAKEKNHFDNLVLIAPPRMLGFIRKELSKPAREAVSSSLSKNLVHCREDEIISRLKSAFKKIDQLGHKEAM